MKFLKYIGFVGLLAVISFFLFNEKEIDKYDRRKQTSELATIFNELLINANSGEVESRA